MTEKNKKVVFISSPHGDGAEENKCFTQDACLYAILLGYTPIAPHLLYPQIIPDNQPGWNAIGMGMCCDLLARCDEFWVCGSNVTHGMATEQEQAKTLGLWIRYVPTEQIQNGVADFKRQYQQQKVREQ